MRCPSKNKMDLDVDLQDIMKNQSFFTSLPKMVDTSPMKATKKVKLLVKKT